MVQKLPARWAPSGAVRQVVPVNEADRRMDVDIQAVLGMLRDGALPLEPGRITTCSSWGRVPPVDEASPGRLLDVMSILECPGDSNSESGWATSLCSVEKAVRATSKYL
jgi:hypothetical protein